MDEDDDTHESDYYCKILHECRKTHQRFIDEVFPASDESILKNSFVRPTEFNLEDVKWLRPENIHEENFYNDALPWTVCRESASFNDIIQGMLGDCWLLSSIAVILERPELLHRILITKHFSPEGCYQVRLCHNGEWKVLILDDQFPCDQKGFLYFSRAKRKQLWVPLIEKAMAKLYGSYEALIAGQTIEGLSALTGYPCECIRLEQSNSSSSNEDDIDLDVIWARLLSMKEAGYVMGASCGRTDITDDNIFTDSGLLPRHAYSVLNVKEINGHRLIQLRNPWGRCKWLGEWSNYVDEQQHQSAVEESSSGIFWMSFDDFALYFRSIDVCKIAADGWRFERRLRGNFKSVGIEQLKLARLNVTEPCEIEISLYHHQINNNNKRDVDLSYVLIMMRRHHQNHEDAVTAELVDSSSQRTISKQINGAHFLKEPGEYLIVPLSFNLWHRAKVFYTLAIHSTKDESSISARSDEKTGCFLADLMIELCMKEGVATKFDWFENVCLFILKRDRWRGLVAVAENRNAKSYFQVVLDCEISSRNVVSTRKSLKTVDSVPPMHRQVLAVLSPSNEDELISIGQEIKARMSSHEFLKNWEGLDDQFSIHVPCIDDSIADLHEPRKIKTQQKYFQT